MKLAIVLPTYNEQDNLVSLVEHLLTLAEQPYITIVDDASPDGTGQIADNLAAQNSTVHVIHRQAKGGRGSAVLDGFSWALENLAPELLIEMDADFSHDPADVPRLLNLAQEYDVVIGSRYTPGSRIEGWGLKRRLFSYLANFYAHKLLRIPIHDYTNCFRCYCKPAAEMLSHHRFRARGYIVASEIAYLLHRAGFRFGEVPTVFLNRRRGTSNINFGEIMGAFLTVLSLRLFPPSLPTQRK